MLWFSGISTRTCKSTCAAFEDYGEVPETAPLDFTEDEVTWFASTLSAAAGTLGGEAIELRNWLLCFGCALEELHIIITRLEYWIDNSPPFWTPYPALMACSLVVLYTRTGVRPLGIGEKIRRALAKLVMRSAGD